MANKTYTLTIAKDGQYYPIDALNVSGGSTPEPTPTPSKFVGKNLVRTYSGSFFCVGMKDGDLTNVHNLSIFYTNSGQQLGGNKKKYYNSEVWGHKNCNHYMCAFPMTLAQQDEGRVEFRHLAEYFFYAENLVDEFQYLPDTTLLYEPFNVTTDSSGNLLPGNVSDFNFTYVTSFSIQAPEKTDEQTGDPTGEIDYTIIGNLISNQLYENICKEEYKASFLVPDLADTDLWPAEISEEGNFRRYKKTMLKFVNNYEEVQTGHEDVVYWKGNMQKMYIEVISGVMFDLSTISAPGDSLRVDFLVYMRGRNFN